MTDNKGIRGGAEELIISLRLGAFVRKDKPGVYEVYCPALDLWSMGNTVAETKKNIAEAVELFTITCYEMGTLNEVLMESGFRFPGQKRSKGKKRARKIDIRKYKHFRFSAKVVLSVAGRGRKR